MVIILSVSTGSTIWRSWAPPVTRAAASPASLSRWRRGRWTGWRGGWQGTQLGERRENKSMRARKLRIMGDEFATLGLLSTCATTLFWCTTTPGLLPTLSAAQSVGAPTCAPWATWTWTTSGCAPRRPGRWAPTAQNAAPPQPPAPSRDSRRPPWRSRWTCRLLRLVDIWAMGRKKLKIAQNPVLQMAHK